MKNITNNDLKENRKSPPAKKTGLGHDKESFIVLKYVINILLLTKFKQI